MVFNQYVAKVIEGLMQQEGLTLKQAQVITDNDRKELEIGYQLEQPAQVLINYLATV